MANNAHTQPSTSRPAPAADASIDPDQIDLVVLSPSPEVPDNGRMNFHGISLDTTIAELKSRIQNGLPARPTSLQQRLIYRGRPLMDGGATLRQILRGQQSPAEYSDSYTLHLVLPPSAPANAPAGGSAAPIATTPTLRGHIPRTVTSATDGTLPQPQIINAQFMIAQAQGTQQALQQQLNLLQQQMTGNPMMFGQAAGVQPMHNPVQFLHQINGGQIPQMAASQVPQWAGQVPVPFPPGPATHTPTMPELLARQQMRRVQAGMNAAQQQNVAQNDQGHAQNTQNAAQAEQTLPQNGAPIPDGTSNIASEVFGIANGPVSASEVPTIRVQETTGPNGERIRIVTQQTNLPPSRQGTPVPNSRPGSAGTAQHTQDQTGMNRSSSRGAPPMQQNLSRSTPRHFPYPFPVQQPSASTSNSSSQTTAWVLSSPNGPQALLFAPGHGYFASPSTTSATLAPSRTMRIRNDPRTRIAQGSEIPQPPDAAALDTPAAAARAVEDGNQAPEQIALQPQRQVRARPQNRNQPNPENENDLFAMILQRGWLFLRLYMFTFVLSDAGTWRRWILLAIAIFACLLPRENPINNFIAAVRRHVDTLVGPPALGRPRGQVQGQAGAGNLPGNITGRSQPRQSGAATTPQEAAARLLRQHQERHPNVFRDTLFRVERALALFFASLVPGVGERHVRAREEARRVLDDEMERERVARESEQPQITDGAERDGVEGSSEGQTQGDEKSTAMADDSNGAAAIEQHDATAAATATTTSHQPAGTD